MNVNDGLRTEALTLQTKEVADLVSFLEESACFIADERLNPVQALLSFLRGNNGQAKIFIVAVSA